jgi:hypothetical protein
MSPAFLEAFWKLTRQCQNGCSRVRNKTHIHGIAASGDFASMTFGKTPVQSIGERVLLQVDENFIFDFEFGVVCCFTLALLLFQIYLNTDETRQ